MMRPNSLGLARLEQLIRENGEAFDSTLLYELEDAYTTINDEMDEAVLYDAEDVDYHLECVKDDVKCLIDEVISVFDFDVPEDDETSEQAVDRIQQKIEEVVNSFSYSGIDYEEDDFRTDIPVTEEEQIKKMIDSGYTFTSGAGLELTKEKQLQQEKEEAAKVYSRLQKSIDSEWRDFTIALGMEKVEVTKDGDEKYILYSYDRANATYDKTTGKVSGKGARKFKEQLLVCAVEYIRLEEKMFA